MPISVLIVYDRKGAAIEALAEAGAEGVESTGIAHASVKSIEEARRSDLLDSDAIMLGSPNWSGHLRVSETMVGRSGRLMGGRQSCWQSWRRIHHRFRTALGGWK